MSQIKTDNITTPPVKPHRTFITPQGLAIFGCLVVSLAAGIALFFIEPIVVLLGVIGILSVYLVMKYHTVGLFIYMAIYFLRPGERYPSMASLRIEFLFGALLLVSYLFSKVFKGEGVKLPTDRISIGIFSFFSVLALSTLFSEWPSHSYEYVLEFLKVLIYYYFIVSLVTTEKKFKMVFSWMVILLSFICVEATIGFFQGNFHMNQGVMRIGGTTSFGEHANSLAMYAATTIPMLIYMRHISKSSLAKIACLTLIVVCLMALVLTGSRSGLLCVIAIALTYAWLSPKRVQLLFVVFIVGISGWLMMPDMYKARYSSMTNEEVDDSSQGRLDAWKAGLNMIIEKPLLGVGPGVFAAAYFNREGVWLAPHSLYVEIAATLGLIGLAIWFLFLLALFKALSFFKKQTQFKSGLLKHLHVFASSNYAIIIGLLVAGVFGHILFRDTWYMMAGLMAAKSNLVKKQLEQN